MKARSAAVAVLCAAVALAGCSFENKYEREADKITKAVMANNLSDVKGDLAPALLEKITRVQIAEASDELNDQGKLESIKEVNPCPADTPVGEHCFLVKFEKSTYQETLAMDDQDKVVYWHFRIAN